MCIAFKDRPHVLYLADGKTMMAKGLALVYVTVETQMVLDLVYAAPIT